MIKAKVVNDFKELQHDGHIYKVGDVYPALGHEATEERILFLSSVHPEYNKIYLAEMSVKNEHHSSSPKHVGGGWYELSNGERVQGKDEAIEAERALTSGE